MKKSAPVSFQPELQSLRKLTHRVGNDPLLTQASSGNTSQKQEGVLWIKASGRWMANALQDDIFIPLDLADVIECVRHGVDPADRHPGTSLETAMHAVLPHSVVLHLHCVNTIAWAVRSDAEVQIQHRLQDLPWRWIPYVESGLPLARAIARSLAAHPGTCIFVLGNHGLVVAAESVETAEVLLHEVRCRLSITPRKTCQPKYGQLLTNCDNSDWELPGDDDIHVLGTDPLSQSILSGGVLLPCQAIFFESVCRPGSFRLVPHSGVVVSKSINPVELEMLAGLAQVVRRLSASAPLRYLTDSEIEGLGTPTMERYRKLCGLSTTPSLRLERSSDRRLRGEPDIHLVRRRRASDKTVPPQNSLQPLDLTKHSNAKGRL